MFPTPIHKMNHPLGTNTLYIKRDDAIHFSFGGNKYRKAVHHFDHMEKEGHDTVITVGGSSSNHCRIIANMAAQKNIPCHTVITTAASDAPFNLRLMDMLGATIITTSKDKLKETVDQLILDLKSRGKNPYYIKSGGHGYLGTKAYIEAYREISDYEKENGITFDHIFLASGTGTTEAGLVAGKILAGDEKTITGIAVSRTKEEGEPIVLDSVNDYLKRVGRATVTEAVLDYTDDYLAGGYEAYNQPILDTIRDVLRTDGIPLDPVYTAKGFWGMCEYIKTHDVRGKNILFLHTGGAPIFFDAVKKITE